MGKRAANKLRNEQEIVNKAIQLFIKKGDEATTISDIVAETDLAFGTFYNYFRSKSEIWDKIISDLFFTLKMYKDRLEAPSIYEFIYNSLYPIVSVINTSPHRELVVKNPSSFRDAYFRNEKIYVHLEIFERDMRANKAFQHLPDHRYKMTVYAVIGACLETFIQSNLRKDNFTAAQITDHVASVFESGLRQENDSNRI